MGILLVVEARGRERQVLDLGARLKGRIGRVQILRLVDMALNRPGCLASMSTEAAISVETEPEGWQVTLTKALVSPRRNRATNQLSWRARKIALPVVRW